MCGISVVQFSHGRALCRDGVLYMHACMGVLCMVEGTLLFMGSIKLSHELRILDTVCFC